MTMALAGRLCVSQPGRPVMERGQEPAPFVKVRVFKAVNGRWYWGHDCAPGRYTSGPVIARNAVDPPEMGSRTWGQAFRHGRIHARGCR
jgi:hypothetical protein